LGLMIILSNYVPNYLKKLSGVQNEQVSEDMFSCSN